MTQSLLLESLSAQQIFDDNVSDLKLSWIGGLEGADRKFPTEAVLAAAAFEESEKKLKLTSVTHRLLSPGFEIKPSLSNGKLLIIQYAQFVEMLHNQLWITTELKDFALARIYV